MNLKSRFENPYFIIGLIGVIFSAAGIDFESLINWSILWHNILNILGNPFLLMSVIVAIIGVFVDPTTKGFKDSSYKLDEDDIKEFL